MNSGMFVVRDDGILVEMTEQPYESEDLLQRLLANYPNLLAGDQIDSENPRRWLLITREAGVPREVGGGDHWSVDHLFLDQDGVPTLVEVKRSSDTRIRREVVGQMLDYAANAVVYWPVETIRATFEARCSKEDIDPESLIAAALGVDDAEALWDRVRTNLQAGKVRMVFVADNIPPELQRIVEFLNGQMTPAEMLAVEIRQYRGQDLRTLVPRVIGRTALAETIKDRIAKPPTPQWNETTFFEALAQRRSPQEMEIAREIYSWAQRNFDRFWWGKGKIDGSCYCMLDHDGLSYWLMVLWTSGVIEIPFMNMRNGPFGDNARRRELLDRLNTVPGIAIPPTKTSGAPNIPLAIFADVSARNKLFDVLAWALAEIRASW